MPVSNSFFLTKKLKKELVRVPVEFLASFNGRSKPYLTTWLKLKAINRSSHFKDITKQYPSIAKQINVSESTLRNHVRDMKDNGFATITNGTLRLVSVWRNPIKNKERKYTQGHYGRLSKVYIHPENLKIEVQRFQIIQQLKRQAFRDAEKRKAKGQAPKKDIEKRIKEELLTSSFQNGTTRRKYDLIQNDSSIPDSKKDEAYEMFRKGQSLVCEALAAHLACKNEKVTLGSETRISMNKISDLTGYSSHTSIRAYRRAFLKASVLTIEQGRSRKLIGKKFTPHHHYKDKFGNIFKKECNRYSFEVNPLETPLEIFPKKIAKKDAKINTSENRLNVFTIVNRRQKFKND
jgi:hypothetical protein